MNGTTSKQVDVLFRGLVDYYAAKPSSDITVAQVEQRDKLLGAGSIVCDDALDDQVLALQTTFIAAEGNRQRQNELAESAIALLS